MIENLPWNCAGEAGPTVVSHEEFWFSLKLRVESTSQLWQAAALRCMSQSDVSYEEVDELIGPIDDPSIADCLMILALPERIPGCTRLDVSLQSAESVEPATGIGNANRHSTVGQA
ncbi:hypothetical protein EDF59_10650 [Novosphingobium sp. ST904]|nr:hypothetical protein EDF59_10650 [Novosphingobium sp. ST904]